MSSKGSSKVSGELFTLTYGALVAQLVKDYEEPAEVNKQLDKMGYNIGVRLIDDFLAHSGVGKCNDFRETAEVIAKVGFKMFLGITPNISHWSSDSKACSLILEDNPLSTFVELPDEFNELQYSNIICGVLRGALEVVQMRVDVKFVKDSLRGDDVSEIRLELLELMADEAPPGDD
eukprot:m.22535 g.22535  ORF g.22535 m.22535 type:complete len:176 (-) comp7409_c0_seq3:1186-1713(-)